MECLKERKGTAKPRYTNITYDIMERKYQKERKIEKALISKGAQTSQGTHKEHKNAKKF